MKGLGIFDKFIFVLNSLVAVALLLGYILPYIPPKSFAILSVLSLLVPVLIIINAIFLLYWVLRLKRQMLLSLIVLLIGLNHVLSLYKFTNSDEVSEANTLKIMSYNVKQFNFYKSKELFQNSQKKIASLVDEKGIDILCIQEYNMEEAILRNNFKYNYRKSKGENRKFGMAIFSNYEIINSGSLNFPEDGNNNAIFADIVVAKDTLRIFNTHLQSFSINPHVESLQKEDSKTLIKRLATAFKKQQVQAEILIEFIEKTPYKVVVAGDFNNSAFSYVYHKIRSNKFNDAFKIAGNGFGQTFSNEIFPLRIDYILIDKAMEVDAFQKFNVDYSDHFPIMTTIKP